mgnify:CR=1 FL=1
MKFIKRIFLSVVIMTLLSFRIVKANYITRTINVERYTSGFYIAVGCLIGAVMAVSIILLKRIYKKNQEDKSNKCTEDKNKDE